MENLVSKYFGYTRTHNSIDIKQHLKDVTGVNFTTPQVGILTLCEIVGNECMRKYLSDANYYKSFEYNVGMALSTMFVPIERHPKYKPQWKNCQDIFEFPPDTIKEDSGKIIAEPKSHGYILLQILNRKKLITWAISCMMVRCYITLGERHKFLEEYYRQHVLDVQLVVNESSGFVCLQIDNSNISTDLTDLDDVIYLEQANETGFQFISTTIAVYTRILLYLDPHYELLDPAPNTNHSNSYFMYTSRDVGCYSKLFFYAHEANLHCNQEVGQQPKILVNKISDLIFKFILEKNWYDRCIYMGYDIDQLDSLFQIGNFLNDKEIIISAAKFICKIRQNKHCFSNKHPFVRYTLSKEQAIDLFDKLFKDKNHKEHV